MLKKLYYLLLHFVEELRERWIFWQTGKSKQQRQWEEWCHSTICYKAHTVENYFANFKHIIELDSTKVWNWEDPFGWYPVQEFQQFEWPRRPLGQNAVVNWFRGGRNRFDGQFHINDMWGRDHVFAATNNDEDALLIALKFS